MIKQQITDNEEELIEVVQVELILSELEKLYALLENSVITLKIKQDKPQTINDELTTDNVPGGVQ